MVHGATVFSGTTAWEREALGERVTGWLREHPEVEVVGQRALQSSNERGHCLSLVLFWCRRAAAI